jgi:hypothetical protein
MNPPSASLEAKAANPAPEPPRAPRGFSRSVNDYLNDYIRLADSKASAVVGLNTLLLGLVMAWSDTDQGSIWVHVFTIALFALGAGLGAFVILPRMPRGSNGVIFWGDIRTYPTVAAYQEKLRSLSDQDVEDSYAYQNFYVSHVLHEKHRYLRLAMFLTALGVAMAVMDYWWL